MKKIIITENQLKTLLKRRALDEMEMNPEADEINPEDLDAAAQLYDVLKLNRGQKPSDRLNEPSSDEMNIMKHGDLEEYGNTISLDDFENMNPDELSEYDLNLNEGQIKMKNVFKTDPLVLTKFNQGYYRSYVVYYILEQV